MRTFPRPCLASVCLVLLLALAAPAAHAEDCIHWSDLPTPLAELETGGAVQAVVRVDDLVYVATDARLLVADLGAATPAWIGALDLPGDPVLDLAVGVGTAVVAFGAPGALIVDVGDPAQPGAVGTVPYRTEAVAFAGDLLCAISSLGLTLYDIADPAAPVQVGSQGDHIAGLSMRVTARADACWVFSQGRFGSVRGYDLSDPTLPLRGPPVIPVLALPQAGKPVDAVLAGDVLHLLVRTEWSDGISTYFADTRLCTVDAADPATPAQLGELFISGDEEGTGLAVEGGRAVVGLPATVALVDVGDPTAPAPVDVRSALGATPAPLALVDDRLVLGADALRVLDLAAPDVTPELGRLGVYGQYVAEPVAGGSHLFIGMANMGEPFPGGVDEAGIAVYDVTDPAAPTYVLSVGGPWTATVNAVVGEYLYGDGLCHWPSGTWLTPTGSLPGGVATLVQGTALYGAGAGLGVWDVSDPAAPVAAGTFLVGRTVRHVAAAGTTVAVVCTDALVLLDASDPLVPVERATMPLDGTQVRAALDEGWLALVGATGYQLVDVRDPAAPVPGAFLAAPGLVDVVMRGNISYAASATDGVLAIVHGPDGDARILGRHLADIHTSRGLAVVGDGLFVVHDGVWDWPGASGVMVRLATECPGTVATAVESFDLVWRGGVCHLELRLARAAADLRLVVRAGRDERVLPWRPAGAGAYTAEDDGLFGAGGRVVTYVVQARDGGGAWIDLARTRTVVPATVTTLGYPSPNPFNPVTTVAYVLAEPGPVELAVFGLDGRRVRTLVAGHRDAGPHEGTWNGRDDRGRRVAAGLYLIRLETATTVGVRKAALVK